MTYWEEVREVLKKGVDLAAEGLKEGAQFTVDKGKDAVLFVQLKKDLFIKQRELHNLLADLGDKTRTLFNEKGDIYKDEEFAEKLKEVVEVENECKIIENKIANL